MKIPGKVSTYWSPRCREHVFVPALRSNASVTFGVTPDSLMDAWMRQLSKHGCRSYWITMFNNDKTKRLAKLAKASRR